ELICKKYVIVVTRLREQFQTEKFYRDGYCSHLRDGETYVYRLCDSRQYVPGILVDISERKFNELNLLGTHRGKIIFYNLESGDLSAQKLSDNAIVVTVTYFAPTIII
ncbi:hypothetical protein PENTCL1PPCAC_7897, partial [Pristionchus entomophagus]